MKPEEWALRIGAHMGPSNHPEMPASRGPAAAAVTGSPEVRSLLVPTGWGLQSLWGTGRLLGPLPQLAGRCGQEEGRASVCAHCPRVWRRGWQGCVSGP